jgi:hypothetical protein
MINSLEKVHHIFVLFTLGAGIGQQYVKADDLCALDLLEHTRVWLEGPGPIAQLLLASLVDSHDDDFVSRVAFGPIEIISSPRLRRGKKISPERHGD